MQTSLDILATNYKKFLDSKVKINHKKLNTIIKKTERFKQSLEIEIIGFKLLDKHPSEFILYFSSKLKEKYTFDLKYIDECLSDFAYDVTNSIIKLRLNSNGIYEYLDIATKKDKKILSPNEVYKFLENCYLGEGI